MSSPEMIQKLKNKRKEIATREGKELFMILSNATIEEMARVNPQSKEDLILVKGWGEKKIKSYGDAFLEVLRGSTLPAAEVIEEDNLPAVPKRINIQIGQEAISFDTPKTSLKKSRSTPKQMSARQEESIPFSFDSTPDNNIVSVSEFLGNVNITLSQMGLVKIKGEIDDVSIRSGYAFFELKESLGGFTSEASLGCFVGWRCFETVRHLLESGMEVVISGYPKIYVKNGSFRLEVTDVEPIGEGALQKAFEALKSKLSGKGYFDAARKRPLPSFVRKIGLITSITGAAVVDFRKNLGDWGFEIDCLDVRVEGDSAEESIVGAIRYFNENNQDIDVLVLIRGGGSLQSLKAFNSERVADAVFYSRIPVITGIGHERDETIVGFTSDLNCSTPTAVATFLRSQFEVLENNLHSLSAELVSTLHYRIREKSTDLHHKELQMVQAFEKLLLHTQAQIDSLQEKLRFALQRIFLTFHNLERNFVQSAGKLDTRIHENLYRVNLLGEKIKYISQTKLEDAKQKIHLYEQKVLCLSPEAILNRGYSIVYNQKGTVLKNTKNIQIGEELKIRLAEGKVTTEVKHIE